MNQEPMTDILDITGNIQTPWPDRLLVVLAVVTLVVMVLIFRRAYRFYQKRFKNSIKALPPIEQAILRLRALLKDSNLTFDQKYFNLTEVIKHYVTDDLKLNCHDKTLEEIRQNFSEFSKYINDGKLEAQLLDLLERSEQIKFAKVDSQQEVFINDVIFAETLVQHCNKLKVKA